MGRRVVIAAHITAGVWILEQIGEADRPDQRIAARVVDSHGLVDRLHRDRRVAGEAQSGKGARRPHAEPLVGRREVTADQRHVGGVVNPVEVGDEIAGTRAPRAGHVRRTFTVGLGCATVKRRVRKRPCRSEDSASWRRRRLVSQPAAGSGRSVMFVQTKLSMFSITFCGSVVPLLMRVTVPRLAERPFPVAACAPPACKPRTQAKTAQTPKTHKAGTRSRFVKRVDTNSPPSSMSSCQLARRSR